MKDKQLCILAVDDCIDVLDLIKLSLEATTKWRVFLSSSAQEALAHAHRVTPDIILSDIQMPHMNGIEMVEKLRSHPKTSNIPIILLTTLPHALSSTLTERLHHHQVLRKPFNWFTLADSIVRGLESTRQEVSWK